MLTTGLPEAFPVPNERKLGRQHKADLRLASRAARSSAADGSFPSKDPPVPTLQWAGPCFAVP
jgi:hypothetical protein